MLTDRDLAALRALEAEVVAHDGCRLKLELPAVQRGDVATALRWDGDRLVGYAGGYRFGSPPEIAGMVAPDHRRSGIGTSLLRELLTERSLLVVPAGTAAGQAFAQAHGGVPDHAEHHLVLGETPETPEDPSLTVRRAEPRDAQAVRELLREAFDWEPPEDVVDRFGDSTRVVERDGEPVGTLRVSDQGGIYGFAVRPDLQGRGIGRDALARTCRELRAAGVPQVTLEVETRNAAALGLYTSVGFVPAAGEDYWEVQP